MPNPNPRSSSERSRAYRAPMKAKGFRRVEFWLRDVRSPEFAAEAAHRQSLAIATVRMKLTSRPLSTLFWCLSTSDVGQFS